MVEFSFENLKLNETRYFSVSFKPSLKCGIAENVNFRKCRSRVRERTSTSASFLQENSILNETRYFGVSFKSSYYSESFPFVIFSNLYVLLPK